MAAVERYKPLARWLHALAAMLVGVLAALGVAMTRGSFAFDVTLQMYQWHKALGVAVLALMLVRLLARATSPPPPLPAAISSGHARAAGAVHRLLYVLLLSLPVSGWLMVSASPLAWPIVLPGLGELPLLPALVSLSDSAKPVWFGWLRTVHGGLAVVLGVLVSAHVAGAAMHGRAFRARMRLGHGKERG